MPFEILSDVSRNLRFYSRLPVPAWPWERDIHARPDFRTMPRVLPIAGALIGMVGAGILGLGSCLGLGPWLCASLAIAALTFATGAFHEDGIADMADGFGGGRDPAHRLDIMKDSRIGAFGGAALMLTFLLRIGALAELTGRVSAFAAMAAMVAAASLSRSLGLVPLTFLPPARLEGFSALVGRPTYRTFAIALAIAIAIASMFCAIAGLPLRGLIHAMFLSGFAALAMTRMSAKAIGGQTGDVAGAVQQITEIGIMIGLLIGLKP